MTPIHGCLQTKYKKTKNKMRVDWRKSVISDQQEPVQSQKHTHTHKAALCSVGGKLTAGTSICTVDSFAVEGE